MQVKINKKEYKMRKKCMDLIEKVQTEIEIILEDMDIYDIYHISVLSMFRTYQLIKKIQANFYYSSVNELLVFIELNKYKILDFSPDIVYGEVCEFLESSAELVENCDYEEASLIYELEYEIFENWYYFVNIIKYGFTQEDKNILIDFIVFPISFLDDYLSNFYDEKYKKVEIQNRIEKDVRFTTEIQRIFEDINIIKSLKDEVKKQAELYLRLDITADI